MIPISIHQPFTQPNSQSDIVNHITNTTSSPNSSNSPKSIKLPSHHASSLPRLIVDETVLQHIQTASNNTFRLTDPCILLKRTVSKSKSSSNSHNDDDGTIVEQSQPHPLFELYKTVFRSDELIDYSIPNNEEEIKCLMNTMMNDIIFYDLYNVPQLYIPCLLEITTSNFTNNVNSTSFKTYIHPDSQHFGLQFPNHHPQSNSQQQEQQLEEEEEEEQQQQQQEQEQQPQDNKEFDFSTFWLIPIRPQHIQKIEKLHFYTTSPKELSHYINSTLNTPNTSLPKTPNLSKNIPIPAIPEAILHQMINNANQLPAQFYKDNALASTTLTINCSRLSYSNIISTYGLFSTLKHRVTTMGGQSKIIDQAVENNSNNNNNNNKSMGIPPSPPGVNTIMVQTIPWIDINKENDLIQTITKSIPPSPSPLDTIIQPNHSPHNPIKPITTLNTIFQSPNVSKVKIGMLHHNINKTAPITTTKQINTNNNSLKSFAQNNGLLTESFSKWLFSIGFLYLLGQVIPPSSTVMNQTTLLSPLPFSAIPTPVLTQSLNNTTIPIFDGNHHAQLLSYTHSTLSLAQVIVQTYINISITQRNTKMLEKTQTLLFVQEHFLHKYSTFFNPYLVPTSSQLSCINPTHHSFNLPTPDYLVKVEKFILSTLFANYTIARPHNCAFILLNGPHGSGKKYFLSTLQSTFYSTLLSQPSHYNSITYPVLVTLHIDQLRQAVYHAQSTSLTIPYYTHKLVATSDNADSNSIKTIDSSGGHINITLPEYRIEGGQSIPKVLDTIMSSLLEMFPSIILHIEDVELMMPIQLAFQNIAGNAMHLTETDQDYAIMSYFQQLKQKMNFNPLFFSSDHHKYQQSSQIHGGNPYHYKSLVVVATTTILSPVEELHPQIIDLFDDIVHLPTLNQQERYKYLQYFINIANHHGKITVNNNNNKNSNNNRQSSSPLNQVIDYISSITRGCTIGQLKLLIDRAIAHNALKNGFYMAEQINLNPFSLLIATQSIQQLIDIDLRSSGASSNTLLSSLSLFPHTNDDNNDTSNETSLQSLNSQQNIVGKSIWDVDVTKMIVPIPEYNTKHIISLLNYPQYVFYRAYTPIQQLLSILTSHVHLLPSLRTTFQQARERNFLEQAQIQSKKLEQQQQLEVSPNLVNNNNNNNNNNNDVDLLQWLPTGLILVGPHTSGKTYILRTVIQHVLRLPCIFVTQTDIVSSYVGESEKNLKKLFHKAQSLRPCVLIFDDLHELAARNPRDRSNVLSQTPQQQNKSTLTSLLSALYCPIHSNENFNDQINNSCNNIQNDDAGAICANVTNNQECLCDFTYEHYDSSYRFRDLIDDDNDSKTTSQSLLSELMSCLDKRHDKSTLSPPHDENNLINNKNDSQIEPIYVVATTTSLDRIPQALLSKGRFEQVIKLGQYQSNPDEVLFPMSPGDDHDNNCDGDDHDNDDQDLSGNTQHHEEEIDEIIGCSLFTLMNDILVRKLTIPPDHATNTTSSPKLQIGSVSILPSKSAPLLCDSVKSLPLKVQRVLSLIPIGTLQTFLLTAIQHQHQRLFGNHHTTHHTDHTDHTDHAHCIMSGSKLTKIDTSNNNNNNNNNNDNTNQKQQHQQQKAKNMALTTLFGNTMNSKKGLSPHNEIRNTNTTNKPSFTIQYLDGIHSQLCSCYNPQHQAHPLPKLCSVDLMYAFDKMFARHIG